MGTDGPIAVYLLLPPLALEAGRSGTSALRFFNWAVPAHTEDVNDSWYRESIEILRA